VPVRKNDRRDVLLKFFEDFEIRNANIDAIDALFGKSHARIENEHLIAKPQQSTVHPELADTAEGNDFEDVSHLRLLLYSLDGTGEYSTANPVRIPTITSLRTKRSKLKAYALHNLPIYLFKLAALFQLIGSHEQAKKFFRLFLEAQRDFKPDGIDKMFLSQLGSNVPEAIKLAEDNC
jgi:hypothetical protein